MPYKNLFRSVFVASVACFAFVAPVWADGIKVVDVYAIAASPSAKAGATFAILHNESEVEVRLTGASSEVAKRIELHTHLMEDGVMKMREVEGGMVIPAHGDLAMHRGHYHIMMMGLTKSLIDGDEFTMTLEFENAASVEITVPVDLNR